MKKMGRGRIELKKIENANRLKVRFTNRRKVLMKKANHLSILCNADVDLIVFSNTGQVYHFSSRSMEQILSRHGYSAADHRQREQQQLLLCSSSQENGAVLQKDESMTSELKRLQLAFERLKGKELEGMSFSDLISLESPQIESMVGRGSSGPQVEPESSSSDEDDENDNHSDTSLQLGWGKRKKLKIEPPCDNSASQASSD